MWKAVPFFSYVELFPALYLLCRRHAILVSEHFFEGTHKFEDPVSNTTLKLCGGVPMLIAPKYCASK